LFKSVHLDEAMRSGEEKKQREIARDSEGLPDARENGDPQRAASAAHPVNLQVQRDVARATENPTRKELIKIHKGNRMEKLILELEAIIGRGGKRVLVGAQVERHGGAVA